MKANVSSEAFCAFAAGLFVMVAANACRNDDDHGRGNPVASIDSVLTVSGRRVPPAILNRYVADNLGFTSRNGEMRCAYVPLGVERDRVFLTTLCLELVDAGDSLATGSGRGGPLALRIATDSNTVRVASHEAPEDGNRHLPSIRRIFPPVIVDRITDGGSEHNARVAMLEAYLRGEAAARLGLRP
jgi:hypothetical protein